MFNEHRLNLTQTKNIHSNKIVYRFYELINYHKKTQLFKLYLFQTKNHSQFIDIFAQARNDMKIITKTCLHCYEKNKNWVSMHIMKTMDAIGKTTK